MRGDAGRRDEDGSAFAHTVSLHARTQRANTTFKNSPKLMVRMAE